MQKVEGQKMQTLEDIKKNVIHYVLLFCVVTLGIGLFINFGFEYDAKLSVQGIRLSLLSGIIVLLPLILLKNFFFRLLGFVGLAILAFFIEAKFGHYPDVAGLILIFLGIINAALFLVFSGIDHMKDKKFLRVVLVIIMIILLTFSVFRIYKFMKIGYERRHPNTITQTALQKQDCGGITDSYLKGQCFTELAVRNSNPELCLNVFNIAYEVDCLKKLIPLSDYEKICSYFNGLDKERCLYNIAVESKNRNICLLIPKGSSASAFFSSMGFRGRDGCLYDIDILRSDLVLKDCEDYESPSILSTCEKLIKNN